MRTNLKMAMGALAVLVVMQTGYAKPNSEDTSKVTELPILTMHCHNPDLDVNFLQIGEKEAVSEEVQVNINRAAVSGSTLFSNPANEVICTASLTGLYRVVGGIAVRDKQQTSGFEPDSVWANANLVMYPTRTGLRAITFTLPALRWNYPIGNTAFRFRIRYERIQ